ncbi:uncharacterized protein METZ01_LOCUS142901, partial [marine metagenome]
MSVSLMDVDHVATLAWLRFSDEEREQLVDQLNEILNYVEQLDKIDTADVPPTSHVLDLRNVLRED